MPNLDLQIVEAKRACLNCGHVRRSADVGPDYACPACSAVYAKLEAMQRANAEAVETQKDESAKFERRLALQEKFDREQAVREAAENPRYAAAHAVYLLMILPFAITQAAAIAVAYKMYRASDDSWLNDHFHWQIRTFWYLLGLAVLAGVGLLVGAASISAVVLFRTTSQLNWTYKSVAGFAIVCALALVVTVYRIGKGWYRLSQREAP